MDIWAILWIVILIGIGLTVGQFIVGLVMSAVIGLFVLISLPFIWAYEKIKGNR